MANDWIIDVLTDLQTYATKNGLSALSQQLEDTTLVASTEIASAQGKALETVNWEDWNYFSTTCSTRERLKICKTQQTI